MYSIKQAKPINYKDISNYRTQIIEELAKKYKLSGKERFIALKAIQEFRSTLMLHHAIQITYN